jgi:hypothetical protein
VNFIGKVVVLDEILSIIKTGGETLLNYIVDALGGLLSAAAYPEGTESASQPVRSMQNVAKVSFEKHL